MLAEITAQQWGLVTSAQAGARGISRLTLSRLTEAGHLERLAHGVYKDSGAPSDQFEDLRAAWLSTDPKAMGAARLRDRSNGVVVAGASAARLHDVGDLWTDRNEFVVPGRRQSQRSEIRYRQRTLQPRDVTVVQGLPAMTIERTLTDLVEDVGDLSLVGDALRDAALSRNLDFERLSELLAPLSVRNGLTKEDGSALLDRLLEIAGIDADSVARRVGGDPSLGARVAAQYLSGLVASDLTRLKMTPETQRKMQAIQDSLAEAVAGAIAPQLAAMNADAAKKLPQPVMKSGALDDIAKIFATQLKETDAIKRLSDEWMKKLGKDVILRPETLAAIRASMGGHR
jgi:hypothetical protein